MQLKISTYWKCQLIGWSAFTLVTYIALLIGYPGASQLLSRAIITCTFGLLFTHIIRLLIKQLRVFDKRFFIQIIYLLALIIIVTSLANFLYVLALEVTGVLSASQLPNSQKSALSRLFFYLLYQELMVATGWVAIYYLVHYIRGIKTMEEEKANLKIQLIESEAQALRAQMNPHFIFNSLNSIKSLINKNENDKAADYLTTFSKLIRTLFQNSDRREISLYEELETCKLYTQVEKMRFGDKVDFRFEIEENIDLKDIKVPALILQPFIENAIWHGLVPNESGGTVLISVKEVNGAIECMIDDNGIGRELSKQYKAQYKTTHQSKGMSLTRSRLELDKILNDREFAIQVIDKTDQLGKPNGTVVAITFKENSV